MQLTGFQDRVAFVTGAAGGVGLVLVQTLREAGAKVFATDTTEAISALPGRDAAVMWHALDVRDAGAVDTALAHAAQALGPVALGVHAAGVLSTQPITQTSPQEWQRVIDINAGGTFNVLRGLGQHMAMQRGGAIVVVGSNAGGIPRAGMGSYAASKAAAAMLTRCLGLELAGDGVRCNIVAPGSTLTPMLRGMWHDEHGGERVIAGDPASFRTGIPLGKLATPQDIAQAAMFLLSDQAGHITMADLYVDGGATLRA